MEGKSKMHVNGVSEGKREERKLKEELLPCLSACPLLSTTFNFPSWERPRGLPWPARGRAGATRSTVRQPSSATKEESLPMNPNHYMHDTIIIIQYLTTARHLHRLHHHIHLQAVTTIQPRIGHVTCTSYRVSTEPQSNTNTLALARWERRLRSRL